MAFRSPTQSSVGPTSYYPPNVNQPSSLNSPDDAYASATSPTSRSKRPRPLDMQGNDDTGTASTAQTTTDSFIQDNDANDDGEEDDEDEAEGKKSDKKAGRRKIKIEFIQDKSRRHITFSKRKAGIMKKAYELSTLTGTQVLLLVVSETGLVYTFTTAKLQPLVTQPEGKNLIQACLNAPHGQMPSSVGPGQPMSRMNSTPASSRNNVPGGLSIGQKEEDGDDGDDDDGVAPPVSTPTSAKPRTRRRTSSGAVTGGLNPNASNGKANSPTSPNQPAPPTPTLPMHQQGPPPMGMNPQGGHGPQPYAQQGHSQVGNVGYSSPADNAGGYMSGHQHASHPQMMAQYHLNQGGHPHPQAAHWGAPPAQPVAQGGQYGRR